MNRGERNEELGEFKITQIPTRIGITQQTMYRAINNEKIGNALRYFAQHIPYLPSMKAIKLLFFLDLYAILEKGVPITWLEYKAWKFGPVPSSIWAELRHGVITVDHAIGDCSLDDYLDIQRFENEVSGNIEINLKAKGEFDDGEFSAFEMELLSRVVAQFGHLTGYQLSQLSHQKDGPWDKAVHLHQLERRFTLGDHTPDVSIDLAAEIASDDKFEAYLAAKEAMETKIHIRHFAQQHGKTDPAL
jgi:uncharacterized phage-associated protein